jgi:hypothetical protein
VVLLVAPWLEGCGILAQSIAGWDEVVEVDAPDVAHLTVQTVPIGAQVCREDAAGACAAEGVGPWADELPVQVHFQRRERRFGWLLLGMVADFAAVGTVIGVADARGDCQSGTCLGLVVGSAVGLMLATMVDMGAFIFGVALEPPQVVGEVRVVAPAAVTYSARRPGYLPARERLQVDLQGVVRLSLEPEAAEVPIAVGFDRAAAVVAVLPLGGDAPEALRAAAQDRLRIKLVGSGLRTRGSGPHHRGGPRRHLPGPALRPRGGPGPGRLAPPAGPAGRGGGLPAPGGAGGPHHRGGGGGRLVRGDLPRRPGPRRAPGHRGGAALPLTFSAPRSAWRRRRG